MRLRRLLVIPLLLAACAKKKDAPDLAVYQDAESGFSCKAPATWRLLEDQGGGQIVSFFGPPSGEKPFHAAINVYYHPKGKPEDFAMRATAFGKVMAPPRKLELQGREALEFSMERMSVSIHGSIPQRRVEHAVLVPAEKGGFYVLAHTTPAGMQDETRPAFEAVLKSLKI